MTFQKLVSRMVANAFKILNKQPISFGGPDQLPRVVRSLRSYLKMDDDNSEHFYQKLVESSGDKRVRKSLAYFYDNVPYRFLTPWVGTKISRPDLADKELMYGIDAPYSIEGRAIELNPSWTSFIKVFFGELKDNVLSQMANYMISRKQKCAISLSDIICCFLHEDGSAAHKIELTIDREEKSPMNLEFSRFKTQDYSNFVPDHISDKSELSISEGKVCMVTDDRLISQVKQAAYDDKLQAISILANYYKTTPGLSMSLKDWLDLVNRILLL